MSETKQALLRPHSRRCCRPLTPIWTSSCGSAVPLSLLMSNVFRNFGGTPISGKRNTTRCSISLRLYANSTPYARPVSARCRRTRHGAAVYSTKPPPRFRRRFSKPIVPPAPSLRVYSSKRDWRRSSNFVERSATADQTTTAALTALQQLQSERERTIGVPAQQAFTQMATIARSLEQPTREAHASDDRFAWARTIAAAAAERVIAIDQRITILNQERSNHRGALNALLASVGLTTVGEFEQAMLRAQLAAREVEARHAQATTNVELVRQITAKIDKLYAVRSGLQSLKDALGATEFVKHVLQRRQRRLIEVGSLILHEMTSGRYQFTDDFQIFDGESNATRMPHTLSGGEQFLASLALSLAVVEISASAGAHIHSLFLDEGFGTLDTETLQTAMLELRHHARSGRTIGVITHLSSVTEYVGDTIVVRKTIDGSTIHPTEGTIMEENAAAEGLVAQLAVSS